MRLFARNVARLGLVLALAGCVPVGETESWKGIGWHSVDPAVGIGPAQAMSQLESRILALGFSANSPGPIDATHKIFDRAYSNKASTVRVSLDNRSDPNCYSVTVMIRMDSEEAARARDFEEMFVTAIRRTPGWQVGEGPCAIVDDDGQGVQSAEEVRRIWREPG